VDGLIYASSMVMLTRWLLGLGIAATLAANVAHGLGHGLIGAAVALTSVCAVRGGVRGRRRPLWVRAPRVPGEVRRAVGESGSGLADRRLGL
jgi:hypothetical protein